MLKVQDACLTLSYVDSGLELFIKYRDISPSTFTRQTVVSPAGMEECKGSGDCGYQCIEVFSSIPMILVSTATEGQIQEHVNQLEMRSYLA